MSQSNGLFSTIHEQKYPNNITGMEPFQRAAEEIKSLLNATLIPKVDKTQAEALFELILNYTKQINDFNDTSKPLWNASRKSYAATILLDLHQFYKNKNLNDQSYASRTRDLAVKLIPSGTELDNMVNTLAHGDYENERQILKNCLICFMPFYKPLLDLTLKLSPSDEILKNKLKPFVDKLTIPANTQTDNKTTSASVNATAKAMTLMEALTLADFKEDYDGHRGGAGPGVISASNKASSANNDATPILSMGEFEAAVKQFKNLFDAGLKSENSTSHSLFKNITAYANKLFTETNTIRRSHTATVVLDLHLFCKEKGLKTYTPFLKGMALDLIPDVKAIDEILPRLHGQHAFISRELLEKSLKCFAPLAAEYTGTEENFVPTPIKKLRVFIAKLTAEISQLNRTDDKVTVHPPKGNAKDLLDELTHAGFNHNDNSKAGAGPTVPNDNKTHSAHPTDQPNKVSPEKKSKESVSETLLQATDQYKKDKDYSKLETAYKELKNVTVETYTPALEYLHKKICYAIEQLPKEMKDCPHIQQITEMAKTLKNTAIAYSSSNPELDLQQTIGLFINALDDQNTLNPHKFMLSSMLKKRTTHFIACEKKKKDHAATQNTSKNTLFATPDFLTGDTTTASVNDVTFFVTDQTRKDLIMLQQGTEGAMQSTINEVCKQLNVLVPLLTKAPTTNAIAAKK